jgi:hypothetical protein
VAASAGQSQHETEPAAIAAQPILGPTPRTVTPSSDDTGTGASRLNPQHRAAPEMIAHVFSPPPTIVVAVPSSGPVTGVEESMVLPFPSCPK